MLIKIRRGWELPESAATPEEVFLNRRRLLKALAAGPMLLGVGAMAPFAGRAWAAEENNPWAGLYPAKRNERYKVDRAVTPAKLTTTYNNFYEFGSHKSIWQAAQALKLQPWTVRFDGMVEAEKTVDADTLFRMLPIEERVYRMRCVEAWSLVVPWAGIPMKAVIDYARPLGSAKYVVMQTFEDSDVAPGQRQFWYPWPYIEGLTMAEATNELTLIGTGAYGKPMPKQNGAPLRLIVPWKYGFKSVKSIVRFTFTDKRPVGFWEDIAGNEYGFWANVNPQVPHPRWSQATEKVIGTGERIPTQLYNGYAEFVASLYTDLKGEKLFM